METLLVRLYAWLLSMYGVDTYIHLDTTTPGWVSLYVNNRCEPLASIHRDRLSDYVSKNCPEVPTPSNLLAQELEYGKL